MECTNYHGAECKVTVAAAIPDAIQMVSNNQYASLKVRFYEKHSASKDQGAGGYRNPGHNAFDDLVISCQGDNDTRESMYAWELRYEDVYAIDLALAQRMAKTLATAEKRAAKLSEEIGAPATFGQFVTRCAIALRVDTFIRWSKDDRNTAWLTDRNEPSTLSVSDAIYAIDRLIRDWKAAQAA